MLNKIFANQLIVVKRQNDFNKAILSFYENREGRFYKVLETEAFIHGALCRKKWDDRRKERR